MPKKPTIEELLEASAKARREAFGPAPQMPNPMRARLQEEIARKNRPAPAPAKQSLFSLWFSRVAIATAVVLIIGLPLWFQFRPSSTSSGFAPVTENSLTANLAQEEKTTEPSKELSKDQTVAQIDLLKKNEEQKLASELSNPNSSPALVAKNADQPAPTVPANEPAGAPNLAPLGGAIRSESSKNSLALQPGLDAKVALPTPSAPALAASKPEIAPVLNERTLSMDTGELKRDGIALAGKAGQPDQQALSQRFANSTTIQSGLLTINAGANTSQQANFANRATQLKANLKAPVNVMQNFDFQQNGNQIRVVDADGSTYSGEIASVAAKDAKVNQIQNSSNAISFRALGSNNTLNKTVIFEGSYIAPNSPEQSKNQNANQQQVPARIIGVAKVHGGPEIEVDAVPAK